MGKAGGIQGPGPFRGSTMPNVADARTEKINQIIRIVQQNPEAQRFLSYDPAKLSQIEVDAKGHVKILDKQRKWHDLTLKGHETELKEIAQQIIRDQGSVLRVDVAPIPKHILVSQELMTTVKSHYANVQFLANKLKEPRSRDEFTNELMAKGYSRADAANTITSILKAEKALGELDANLTLCQDEIARGDYQGAMQIWRGIVGASLESTISTLNEVQSAFQKYSLKNKDFAALDKAISQLLFDQKTPVLLRGEGFSKFYQRVSTMYSTLRNTSVEVNNQFQKNAETGDLDAQELDQVTRQVSLSLVAANEKTRREELLVRPEDNKELWSLGELHTGVQGIINGDQARRLDEIVIEQSKIVEKLAEFNKAYAEAHDPKIRDALRRDLLSLYSDLRADLDRLADEFEKLGAVSGSRKFEEIPTSGYYWVKPRTRLVPANVSEKEVKSGQTIIRELKLNAKQARARVNEYKHQANYLGVRLGFQRIEWEDKTKLEEQVKQVAALKNQTGDSRWGELLEAMNRAVYAVQNAPRAEEFGKRAAVIEDLLSRANIERSKAVAFMSNETLYEI